MQIGLVVGRCSSTVKHASLESQKLLLTQPLMTDPRQSDSLRPDGPPLIAVDRIGAGPGEKVILTSDGKAIRELFQVENSPIRWAIIGLVDSKT